MKMRVTSIGALAVVAIVLAGVISLSIVNAVMSNSAFVADDLTYRYGYGNRNGHVDRNASIREQNERSENQQQKALDTIQVADETIKQAEETIDSLESDPPNNVAVLLEEAKEHLTGAKEAFESDKYGEAYGLANAALRLARNAVKNLDTESCDESDIDDLDNATFDNETHDQDDEISNQDNETPNQDDPEPVDSFEPPIPNDEPNILTIWYTLASPFEIDPWVHTYILNTSGETLYNVDFRQLIPADLQLAEDSYMWAWVGRYNERMVMGVDSGTYSGTYTYPSSYTYTSGGWYLYPAHTVTVETTVSGDRVTETRTYLIDGETSVKTYTRPATYSYSYHYTSVWSGHTESRTYYYDGGYTYTSTVLPQVAFPSAPKSSTGRD